jgi:hypothetical protein
MESYCFIEKLTRRAFILWEYNFDIVRWARRVNKDVHRLSQNPSSNEEDTTKACWHGDVDLVVLR